MLEAAININCRMICVSTDLVFDGTQGNYPETVQPQPLNVYARTKVEAEKLCLKQKLF